ncbi:hypothetical protein KCH_53160 [Kitasatospora cheerisanensis KCTC 2395]|uniref:Uncharacterized protein n=1 Tax=Kitasatospora cheerisanensis KCTC 2395 TaxID=1348663 RepID=A0A066YXY8_9ACTN|nr:hypothetical protein KCH_53160 [Kitasatospora cheerisanensis KCTC 2395]
MDDLLEFEPAGEQPGPGQQPQADRAGGRRAGPGRCGPAGRPGRPASDRARWSVVVLERTGLASPELPSLLQMCRQIPVRPRPEGAVGRGPGRRPGWRTVGAYPLPYSPSAAAS